MYILTIQPKTQTTPGFRPKQVLVPLADLVGAIERYQSPDVVIIIDIIDLYETE